MSLVTKKIHELTPLGGSVVNSDELVIYDVSANETKKITVGDLYTVGIPASVIPYDNTTIGIDQTNVQDAITWTSFRQFAANTTGSTANDTPSFWKKGNGHSIFSAYVLKDQPYQYGHLINFNNKPSDSGEIFQFYKVGPNGDLYHRGAHSSEPDMLAWRKIVDGDNSTTFKSGGIQTPQQGGYYTDQWGNFVHGSTSTQNTWAIKNNEAYNQFSINFQTGKVINSYLCPTSVNRINVASGKNFAGYLLWVKIGRIVFFQIIDLVCVTATSTHGYSLFQGLPTVASGGGGAFTVQRYATESANGTHLRLSIGNNGSNQGMIFIHYDAAEANSAHYYGNHWYLAAQ